MGTPVGDARSRLVRISVRLRAEKQSGNEKECDVVYEICGYKYKSKFLYAIMDGEGR